MLIPLAWLGFEVPTGAGWGLLAGAYLLGAVPFGWLLVRLLKGVDLRRMGSGNIGATNAIRVLGKPLGLLAFALDCLKGFVPAWFAPQVVADPADASSLAVLAGAAAVVGHVFPVYLRFKGGKAVATGCGALLALDAWIFVVGGLIWLLLLWLGRMVSLASLAMCASFVAVALWRGPRAGYGPEVAVGCAALFLLVLVRHRANIGRILSGQEPRIGQRRPNSAAVQEVKHG
jgi:acyl phosphate:glycerol-3-phosphate acyltransferase